MSYDWDKMISSYFTPILSEIKKLHNQLSYLNNKLRKKINLKRREQIQSDLIKNKQMIEKNWKKILKNSSYFASEWTILSLLYIDAVQAKDNEVSNIIRNKYICLQKTRYSTKDVIQIHLKNNQIFQIYQRIADIMKDAEISYLPLFSFFIKFKFRLAKPYISRDDKEFYIIDNPIKKDKVFGIPMISAGSWKGNLRWTAGKILENARSSDEKIKIRLKLVRLFGHENETERGYFNSLFTNDELSLYERELEKITTRDGLRRGRLHFYPTFFFRIGLEVINPHDRKRKAGTIPIYIECVPEGTCGDFALLYVPFDLMGKPPEIQKAELIEDLNLIFSSLRDMMLIYGFSAKKSSGFGIIKPEFPEQGKLHIKGVLKESTFKNFNELKEIIKEVSDSSIRESS